MHGMSTHMHYIEIEIPVALQERDEIDLVDSFHSFIKNEDGDLGGPLLEAFDLDVQNSRAKIDDVDIDNVNVDEDGDVEIQYMFMWSAFFGCDDIDRIEQGRGAVLGMKKGGKWLFTPYRRIERSTLDEF